MRLSTRKLLDRSFTGLGVLSIFLMGAALTVLLAPIFSRGAQAFLFRGTIEHRELLLDKFNRGDRRDMQNQIARVQTARQPIYAWIDAFENELEEMPAAERRKHRASFKQVQKTIKELFGPRPQEAVPPLARNQYGQTRWDRAEIKARDVLLTETWDHSDPTRMGVKVLQPRALEYQGTALEPLFPYLETHLEETLEPRLTLYWGFLTDKPIDSNIFGGIWPALIGTFYLTIGAMLFAAPLGIIAAIYFVEYAGAGRFVSFLRICVSTLAGVPSIVFGLFGLAFFINAIHVSESKSVLAGSLTLALLILPTIIRASEEAILAVPQTYREAALALGAGKWRTITTVILPAALSGILTGTIISMGRAAGETAPIIFTAAVSVGG
ncbi:phosphate ABC transporter permease PstA, partial [bacterium]|nr:phosphate ABC transporter permease PstA [bacterium]